MASFKSQPRLNNKNTINYLKDTLKGEKMYAELMERRPCLGALRLAEDGFMFSHVGQILRLATNTITISMIFLLFFIFILKIQQHNLRLS